MAWNDIKDRFTPINNQPFYAVIDPEGCWVDSSHQFATTLTWAALDAGYSSDEGIHDLNLVMDWLPDSGYSIIHSNMLPSLADAGLIK